MLKVDAQDKAKLLDPLYTASPRFWAWIGLLVLTMAWGGYYYVRQLIYGLGETGMNRPVYWGVYMVNFVFFIGISHAGTLISAILRVTGAEWRRPITRIAEAITAVALIVGTLQIFVDMGRLDRMANVFRYGRLQSPLLWDAISVTAYFLGSITYLFLPLVPDVALQRDNFPENGPTWRKRLYTILALGWRGNKTQWLRLEKAIGIMAILIIPIAVSVHTIISWILATTVQPGWHSTIFGPYFVVGAIFSGIGALFIAMTVVRKVMGLEEYITERQYRNLGLVFILMDAIWLYFTGAEYLTLAAGQQVNEFPVLASKLWGDFAPTFWLMVAAMLIAFWVMVVPMLIPAKTKARGLFDKRVTAVAGVVAVLGVIALFTNLLPLPENMPPIVVAAVFFTAVIIAGLGLALWLKPRLVTAMVIASALVVTGMWLERWNIIVPTMTHPYLVEWTTYRPTITEISETIASLALFCFIFTLFFKLFPVISIWEIAEGRVIDAAQAQTHIPMPESSEPTKRRFGERRAAGD